MQVNLSWNPVVGALFYRVYRSPIQGGPYTLIGQSNPNPAKTAASANIATTYQDGPSNLVNGQNYYYRVSTVTVDGESAYGVELVALAPNQPASPTGFTTVVT